MKLQTGDLSGQYASAARETQELTRNLSAAQLHWKPPGKWSIVECLDHLNNAERILSRFDRKFEEARAAGWTGQGPFRAGLLAGLYIRWVEPPVRGLRVKSPRAFRPRADADLSDAVPRFLKLQDGLIDRAQKAEGLDLSRIRMSSPILRQFKMSAAEWFAFLAAHQRRHLWQARRVREHPDFPPS
jgi:DinB superfamily